VGYTPQVVSAVWSGSADVDIPLQGYTINGVTKRYWYGGDLSGVIWQDFMATAMEPYPVVGLPGASDTMINGAQLRVPSVVGLSEQEARWAINDAGFAYAKSAEGVYQPGVPAGQIVQQQPEAESMMRAGGTVTFFMSTDQRPGWWYNWPAGWDPLTAPSDWWGGAWPPADWTKNNPSQGWDPDPDPEPEPEPEPEPTPAPTPAP